MRTVRTAASFVLATLVATASYAQNPDTVAEVHRVDAKPGMGAQLEAGRVKHMAWHKQQGDTWAWQVWEVATGPRTGSYLVASPGHQWKDFDAWGAKYGKGDQADANTNLAPYQASSTMTYWVMLADSSRLPAAGSPVAPMMTITTYHVKPGMGDKFRNALRTISATVAKADYPRNMIAYVLANGGPTGTYALLTPRGSMADMELVSPSIRDILEKSLGKGAAEATLESFYGAVEGAETEMLMFRPDLSYIP